MRKILLALMVGILAFAFTSSAFAGYDEGVAAYKQGDYAKALMELRPLAEAGDAKAQLSLGVMYFNGKGVHHNNDEALKWFHLAAEQGYAGAQSTLGTMYEFGIGVSQDYNEALKWYRLAANQGIATSQYSVGEMYAKGHGVTQDNNEALKWYRLAASQGNATAQSNLGIMYARGQGVKQSLVAAYALYSISAPATDTLTEIVKEMSPSQIDEAKSLAERMSKPGALLKELDAYIKTQSP